MAPPMYADLGKQARDVFRKGYYIGMVKLDCKTKSKSGVEFTSGEAINIETGKVSGNCDVKFSYPEQGITLTEKWNTDNIITMELGADDAVAKGSKLSAVGTFSPFTGAWNVVGKGTFKHENAALNVEADVFNGPLVMGGLVFGYGGFLAGYQSAYDAGKGKLTKSNVSLGYNLKDVVLNLSVDGGEDFNGTVYHQVNSNLEAGMSVGFNSASNHTSLGLGGRYVLDKDTSFRAKVDNHARLCTAYEQKLRPGVTLSFCSQIDLRSLNQGGHKIGLGIDLVA